MSKVLLINGSPHAHGCTYTALSTVADELNKYFLHGEMPVAASRYWNAVHGNNSEEVMKDEEGLQTMPVLGRNMAFLIRAIRAERERSGLPEQETKRISTNFIR